MPAKWRWRRRFRLISVFINGFSAIARLFIVFALRCPTYKCVFVMCIVPALANLCTSIRGRCNELLSDKTVKLFFSSLLWFNSGSVMVVGFCWATMKKSVGFWSIICSAVLNEENGVADFRGELLIELNSLSWLRIYEVSTFVSSFYELNSWPRSIYFDTSKLLLLTGL